MLQEAAKEVEKAREAVQQAQQELKEAEELKAQVVSSIAEEEAGQGAAGGKALAILPQLEGVLDPGNPQERLILDYLANKLARAALGPEGTVVADAKPDEPLPSGNGRRGTGGEGSKAPATLEAAGAKVAGQAGEAGLGMPGGRGSRRSASRSRSPDGRLGSLKEKLRKWHSKAGGPSPLSNCRLP